MGKENEKGKSINPYWKDVYVQIKSFNPYDNEIDRIMNQDGSSFDLTKTPILRVKVHVLNCEDDYHFELVIYDVNKNEVEKLLRDFKEHNQFDGEYSYLKMLKENDIMASLVKYDLEI
jgi:hypothetical protein